MMKTNLVLLLSLFFLSACIPGTSFDNPVCQEANYLDPATYLGQYQLDYEDVALEVLVQKRSITLKSDSEEKVYAASFCQIKKMAFLEIAMKVEDSEIASLFPTLKKTVHALFKLQTPDKNKLRLDAISPESSDLESREILFRELKSKIDPNFSLFFISNSSDSVEQTLSKLGIFSRGFESATMIFTKKE